MMMSSKALSNLLRREAINAAAKKPPSKLAKILPPKPKPKFNAKLRNKLELESRKYGNMYSETPKDPVILAEMQSTFRGRKELKRATENDAAGKRLVRNTYIGLGSVMAGATAVGQYQSSQRNKEEAKMKKVNSPMGKPKSRLAPANPGKVLPKQMPLRPKFKAKARKA